MEALLEALLAGGTEGAGACPRSVMQARAVLCQAFLCAAVGAGSSGWQCPLLGSWVAALK